MLLSLIISFDNIWWFQDAENIVIRIGQWQRKLLLSNTGSYNANILNHSLWYAHYLIWSMPRLYTNKSWWKPTCICMWNVICFHEFLSTSLLFGSFIILQWVVTFSDVLARIVHFRLHRGLRVVKQVLHNQELSALVCSFPRLQMSTPAIALEGIVNRWTKAHPQSMYYLRWVKQPIKFSC